MRNYEELDVWKKAHQLVLDVYETTADFPAEEQYSLTSQLRRAAVSIPSNIAEGCGKNSDKDFIRFLTTARGSASELDYQILLSKELGYISNGKLNELRKEVKDVKKMLTGFISALQDSN